ncbi:MAG: VOC family protein, partial [Atribacterota bacterium]
MRISKIDHIGVAVKNLDESLKLYTDILGLEVISKEVVKEQKVKVVFVSIGDSEIEF